MEKSTFYKGLFWIMFPVGAGSIVMAIDAVQNGYDHGAYLGGQVIAGLSILVFFTMGLYAGLQNYNIGTCLEQVIPLLSVFGVPIAFLYLLIMTFTSGGDVLGMVLKLAGWTLGCTIYFYLFGWFTRKFAPGPQEPNVEIPTSKPQVQTDDESIEREIARLRRKNK